MPFNPNDIYTSSGSVQLFNEWVPYVSKFDTSSFYNWEQDNLPLYDLEERTYELWEQNGFNTSAGVPGLALTVSSDAPADALAANRNIFQELSSCIAAIPKVVRFPVLVEVGTIGDLGNLELHNFRIEEGGSIEIINRAFARTYDASAKVTQVQTPTYNKSHNLVSHLSSVDTSNAFSDASCVHLGSGTVIRENGDSRTGNNTHRVIYPQSTLRNAPLTVALDRDLFAVGTASVMALQPYENVDFTSVDDTLNAGLDISATNQATNVNIYRDQMAADDVGMGGNTYLNKLRKLSIKNCDGPIYIRNFFVDAADDATNIQDFGIEVNNSEAVIENCAAIRAKNAGWKFNNSKVTLSRSAFAYRNYEISSTPTDRIAETGYGFHAVNSDVSISSTPQVVTDLNSIGDTGGSGSDCKVISSRNYAGFVLDNSKLTGGVQRILARQALTGGILGSELNTGYGMILNNSEINVKGLIDLYSNDKGIQADGSKIVYENLCVDAHSNEGIRCRNSEFIFDSVDSPVGTGQADRHQLDMSANGQHVDLQGNSLFTFRRKNNIPTKYGNSRFLVSHGVIKWDDANQSTLPAFSVNNNSTLELIHPNIQVSGTDENIQNRPSYGRAIKASNSSNVSLFGSKDGCNFIYGPPGFAYQQNMAGIYGSNNSTVNLHGPTAMAHFGVDVLVEDNSVLNIEPARKRDEFGLEVSGFDLSSGGNHTSVELHATRACLVANKNSTINLTDLGAYPVNWLRTSTGIGYLDLGADYPIGTYNTSAYTSSGCLQFYPNPQDTSAQEFTSLDDLGNATLGLGFTPQTFPAFAELDGLNRFFITDEIVDSAPNFTEQAKITQGGVALRATQNSVVNVKNVHFPLGTNNSPLDGFYYTTSGADCEKFMIWNIADTSRLNASYLSVSGMHPANQQYHGPSAIWASSRDGVNDGVLYNVPASGAPANTPDTGSLSILDVFGAGSGVWVVPSGVDVNSPFDRFYPVSGVVNDETASSLGQAGINVSGTATYKIGSSFNTSKNQGCFRIYWTPKSSARVLQTDLSGYFKGAPEAHFGGGAGQGPISGVVGPAYQIFAQGYNCSTTLSALVPDGETNASGSFPDLLKLSYDADGDGVAEELWTSGFYYGAEMLEENPTQCILDESAAKTFANAQNASVNLGGTARKVTLVRAREDGPGNRGSEAYVGDASGSLGFKSAAIFDLSRDN